MKNIQRVKRRNRWSRVCVLTALLDEVDTLIGNKPQLGYPSISSFVNDAVRRLLEKYTTGEDESGEIRRRRVRAKLPIMTFHDQKVHLTKPHKSRDIHLEDSAT